MEFDPLARDVAPPRHEVESDSEEESNTGGRSRKPFMPPQVQITWQRERAKKGSDLVIFYSEGGEAFLRSQDEVWSEAAQVKANDEQHGSIATTNDGETMLLLLRPSISFLSDQASLNYICSPILGALKPSKLTIVDDYNPSLYITSKETMEDPIRYISNREANLQTALGPGIELFETPNYVLGFAAAMMNECGILGISSTVLLLPRAVNPHLQSWSRIQATSSSLDTQPELLQEELASCLSALPPLGKAVSRLKDSPSILDFLHVRRSKARKTMAQNVSAMYV